MLLDNQQPVQWAKPQVFSGQLTPAEWEWLNDNASLTERLERFAVEVKVEVLSEQWLAAGDDPQQRIWCREVILWGDGCPWVYACSQIPEVTLLATGLESLGAQPMGRILFDRLAEQRFERSDFEFACFEPHQLPQKLCAQISAPVFEQNLTLWGRHSRFQRQQHPLEIVEIFLPDAPMTVPEAEAPMSKSMRNP